MFFYSQHVISSFHNYLLHTSKLYFVLFPTAVLPDKPTNLTVTNITSRSAEISWLDPHNQGKYGLSKFRIKLKKENFLILDIPTRKVNKYVIYNLTPYTTYEISVAAGNRYGFGEETTTSFLTSEGEYGTQNEQNIKIWQKL